MKAAIYNPYLDTLGGGERYSLAFAQVLAKKGWNVDIYWKDASIKKKIENRFGFALENVNFVPDIKRGDGYDVCFWVSDGSIPTLLARKNFLHFQIPFHDVNGKTLLNKMKLFRINKIICNSYFTKDIVDREYGVNSIVIYPPVDTQNLKPGKKEKLILSVGRFSQLKQAKRQDVLIEAFKKLYDSLGDKKWKFVLAGGTEIGASGFVKKLREHTVGYPIRILESPSFRELLGLYAKAKFFWSASGFGINEKEEPEKVEHFGISVVEAMGAGVVPLVFNAGGHGEIVSDSINGFLWLELDSLVEKTGNLVKSPKDLKRISSQSENDSQKYSYENFEQKILELI